MSYAIIGFGKIGQALAKAFARKGIEVSVATTRDPQALQPMRRRSGTHRGHAELAAVLQKASEEIETTYPTPPEFVAQGDRVLVVGVATGKIKPRISRSRTIGSSTLPFEMAK